VAIAAVALSVWWPVTALHTVERLPDGTVVLRAVAGSQAVPPGDRLLVRESRIAERRCSSSRFMETAAMPDAPSAARVSSRIGSTRHTGVEPTDADRQDHPATPEEQRREFEELWATATPVEDVLSA
jgi:hypothetical protein